ncbi:BREX-1 system phosphatase PglZ type B, partial [Candidatus Kaiserbacteria bacterium]|nr:BREX-1 system phosphatase PglZ type B [Candidatus Kaiserbacteria bacterium]
VVTRGGNADGKARAEVTDIAWKGLRCTVAVDGQYANLCLDIRLRAGDPASSVVVSVKPLKANGTASVVVENEDLQGRAAFLVLLGPVGELMAETNTVIGGA